MSWHDLDQLYRQSAPGTIHEGFARGVPIYCSASRLAGVRSRLTRAVWRGKVFTACDCTLINQWCLGKAIRARVFYGPSWVDGKPAIIMDYCGTSHVWADVRDEVREVAPGLFLGVMFLRRPHGPRLKMYFALEAVSPCLASE